MKTQDQKVFKRIYSAAETCEELPWHDEDPPQQLLHALAARDKPGRALDVGCGGGTYSLYLARQGYDVTAIDFMPEAVAMTRQRAVEAGANIEVLQADVTDWSSAQPFDIVLDVGCLHSLPDSMRAGYRTNLLKWLAPGGDFVLTHFSRRGWWDGWPIGPNRVAAEKITGFFGSDMALKEQGARLVTSFPWFMGSSALIGSYWFRRGLI